MIYCTINTELQVNLESVQKQFLVGFLQFLLNFILYLNQTISTDVVLGHILGVDNRIEWSISS